ncbi:hypothetical protein NPIL_160671 [Nephila pilipes]|uniref:Uncharacterized protein n=1 Tax=Nephila pilipes TaxID=299642 RepID=A0A8X6PI12_NEPPI|nr:hypothetical protein NPIL_160671 [Nephila pilipes]
MGRRHDAHFEELVPIEFRIGYRKKYFRVKSLAVEKRGPPFSTQLFFRGVGKQVHYVGSVLAQVSMLGFLLFVWHVRVYQK